MTCPECGSYARDAAAFCTECGMDLLVERETRAPLSVGTWTPDPAHLSEWSTAPLLSHGSSGWSDSAGAGSRRDAEAHLNTPVNEMAGSERAEWIDRVWCSAAGVAR
jgi:hypothetical protein